MAHLIQTTSVPVLIYELPQSNRKSRVEPNLYRRSFESYDQILYHWTVLESNTCYSISARHTLHFDDDSKNCLCLERGARNHLIDPSEKWLSSRQFLKGETLSPKSVRASSPDTRPSTCLDKRHLSGPMTKNSFKVPSRYRKMRIAPATRWIQRPPTPEPATAVFVPQPMYPPPLEPVVVDQPETVLSSPPPAPVVVFPPAPVVVSPPPEPVFTSHSQPENIVPVVAPALPEPTLKDDQMYDQLMFA
ncbi:hypothetical protein NPIL_484591, partial [Nephila pilipes]